MFRSGVRVPCLDWRDPILVQLRGGEVPAAEHERALGGC